MRLDPITVRIVTNRYVLIGLRAWRDLLPDCLASSTLIGRDVVVAAYRLPGGYSNLEPLFPIPNRTVKRVCADDSVHSHAKVGHRQTISTEKARSPRGSGFFFSGAMAALTLETYSVLTRLPPPHRAEVL